MFQLCRHSADTSPTTGSRARHSRHGSHSHLHVAILKCHKAQAPSTGTRVVQRLNHGPVQRCQPGNCSWLNLAWWRHSSQEQKICKVQSIWSSDSHGTSERSRLIRSKTASAAVKSPASVISLRVLHFPLQLCFCAKQLLALQTQWWIKSGNSGTDFPIAINQAVEGRWARNLILSGRQRCCNMLQHFR